MALLCVDFVTALSVAQKPFFTELWNLECSCWKGSKNWFTPIPWFSNSETGPERLNVWVKITPLSGARASLEFPDPKPSAHSTTSHTSQHFPQHLRAQKVWSLQNNVPRGMLRNHLGKEAEKDDLAGASEYLGDREGIKEHNPGCARCSLGYQIWIKMCLVLWVLTLPHSLSPVRNGGAPV